MINAMMTLQEASARIDAGATLMIAGDEKLLAQLPKGKWIGGTSVYFVTETGGRMDRDALHVTEVVSATQARSVLYQGEDLKDLTMNRFDNGLSLILIPYGSKAHEDYGLNCVTFPGLFDQPIMGWIAGVHLDDLGTVSPKVFDGATGQCFEDGAVVLHIELPHTMAAEVDIVNLFDQDPSSDIITFQHSGFSAQKAQVNGMDVDLVRYFEHKKIDTRLPLVANYAGALINVAVQTLDAEKGASFYAPVVPGIDYYLAKPVDDYAARFAKVATGNGCEELACNCVLNYLYGELEGKKTGSFTGPATFGEIGYILLSQTMVHLAIKPAEQVNAA